MDNNAELRQTRMNMECGVMRLADAIAWAREHVQNGWFLAESPEKTICQPFTATAPAVFDEKHLGHCLELIIFGPDAEIRLEMAYGPPTGETSGQARRLWLDENGQPTLERRSACLLANGPGRLEYAEHFAEDGESGMLIFSFARMRGISGVGK